MRTLLFIFFAFLLTTVSAQDVIVRTDSTRINAQVTNVNDRKITYKRSDNPEGPVYEIARKFVARIIYANGTTEQFGGPTGDAILDKHKNSIGLTTSDLLSGVITLNYERRIGGEFGIRVIGSMGVLGTTGKAPMAYYNNNFYYSRYKVFSTGIDVHYFAFQSRRLNYYLGALTEFGQTRRSPYYYYFDIYPYPNMDLHSKIVSYYFVGLTNGATIHASDHVALDLFTSLGWRGDFDNQFNDLSARFGFSIAYKF